MWPYLFKSRDMIDPVNFSLILIYTAFHNYVPNEGIAA